MFSRATRIQRLPTCRGATNQKLNIRLASTQPADAPPTRANAPARAKPSLRTAYLKTWRPVSDVAEYYGLIREIEKRYGKVLQVHLMKDYEDTMKYQMMSFVVFADPQSVSLIPEYGIDLTAPRSPIPKPSHEIGIDDVESRLFFEDNEASEPSKESTSDDASLLGFRLMRSTQDYLSDRLVRGLIYQNTPYRTMEHFQNWAGFTRLDPLNPSRNIKDEELFADPVGYDQIRMRAALQICARNVRPNFKRLATAPSSASTNSSQTASASGSARPTQPLPASTPKTETVPIKASHKTPKRKPEPEITPIPTPRVEDSSPGTVKEASPTSAVSEKPAPPTAETPSTDIPSKQPVQTTPPKKEKPEGPKLVIPPAVPKSNSVVRRKDPKPKIKTVKQAPPKQTSPKQTPPKQAPTKESPSKETSVKPKTTVDQQAKSQSQPEPPKPKGTLAKIWNLFGRS
ncbi:hypothetical protein HYPSUDRAFT_197028 [Hypholoma sublateritium FD-334 SS-4]|uniref:Uncharacterized protein n=1 Tax=Hypholoma sublateritium (strain FD-334 SS-4) TaxID=945553 RepID=A0A0D2LLN0_HYPSF|nr:hypothetical protein HYPSUDRAFT_197028 [Hypholoma sublateritium FD-334 SS-4]